MTKVEFYKSTWGMAEACPAWGKPSLDTMLRAIKEAGYDGVEAHVYHDDPAEVKELCRKHGLKFICQIFPANVDELKERVGQALKAGPVSINSHSGLDKFSPEQGRAFFREALAIEKDCGVPINHETHRHRMFYNPWITAAYLKEFPELRITADLSHWCCVCESLLQDEGEFVEIAVERARHVHARVGHPEGPQVNDPSAPEWKDALAAHIAWWDAMKAAHERRGEAVMTITPEFGPPGYMPTVPHTGAPVADLWKVNLWMRDFLAARWR